MSKLFNPNIFFQRGLGKNAFMQRISDAVLDGYTHYTTGTIPISKLPKLVKKFDINYQVGLGSNQRLHRRRNGLGNAKIILIQSSIGFVEYWLMVTPSQAGDHAAHGCEKLHDSKIDRLEFDGYELVCIDGKMTWRMTKQTYAEWQSAIKHTVRSEHRYKLEQMILRLFSCPGFNGIRKQVGHLASLYRAELKRSAKTDAPNLPVRLGYCRRLKDVGIPMFTIAEQHRKSVESSMNATI